VGTVAAISYAPVKGLALGSFAEVELERTGVRGNRRFHVIGEDGRLLNGKQAGPMVRIAAESDPDGTHLTLRLPDGTVVDGPVATGEPVVTSFYGRPVAGHVVAGAFAEAVGFVAGRPVRLVRVDEPGDGSDRGLDGVVSIVSLAGLELLAREAGVERVDPRRFRMLFTLDGAEANVEDGWIGRRVAVGEAIVAVHGLVGRCAVTGQDPSTGVKDLDTLRVLRRYRPAVEGEEPLPMGVFGGVEQPGRVRVGDPVEAL
jgi:uncharacterized protein YcbX